MSTVPSADAKAVVRAADAMTTQLRRIADALSTPVVRTEVTTGDAPPSHVTADREPSYAAVYAYIRSLGDLMPTSRIDRNAIIWHAVNAALDARPAPMDPVHILGVEAPALAACRRMETRTCPPAYNGPCGDRPCARFESDDPAPWLDTAEAPVEVPATDEERCITHWHGACDGTTRDCAFPSPGTGRRRRLRVLLNRLNNGIPLTADEAQALTKHVATEITEHNTARRGAEQAEERLARIRDMADAWERRLPATIRTATAAEAVRLAAAGDDRPVMFGMQPDAEVRAELEQAQAERDGAYRERAQLLALLASLHPSVIAPAPDVDEPEWQILYLRIGARQASWHIAPRDAELFAHVEHVPADDSRAQWDGHTTEEKYTHIGEHAARLYAEACGRAETPVTSAEAAIERVRALVAGIAHPTSAGIRDYDLGRHEMAAAVVTALTETEQPTTEA